MINDWSLMKKLIWLKKGALSGASEAWTTISGAIVEFIAQRAHKLKSCVVSLSPQQDLHGYDSPWPPGGGANIIPFDQVMEEGWTNTLDGVTATYHNGVIHIEGTHDKSGWTNIVNLNPWATDRFQLPSGVTLKMPANAPNASALTLFSIVDGVAKNLSNGSEIAEGSVATISGFYIAVFGENYFNFDTPLIVTTGDTRPTEFSPYSNICPISGWTGVSVYDKGIQQWDEVWENGTFNTTTGANIDSGGALNQIRAKNLIPINPNALYRIVAPSAIWCIFYDADGNVSTQRLPAGRGDPSDGNSFLLGTPYNTYFQAQPDYHYMRFYCQNAYGNTYLHDISINYPSTDTEYHAYNGNSYSVTFGETVYGATPDIVSGEMPVTMKEIDLGSLSWTLQGGGVGQFNRFYSTDISSDVSREATYAACMMDFYCSILKKDVSPVFSRAVDNCICVLASTGGLYAVSSQHSTAAEFKAAMQGQKFVYKLATPIQTTITPTPITALKGYNAMWSDGGDIEVTVHGTPVEVSTLQALNMLLGGAYHNNQTADDVSDDEALDIILGGDNK